MKKSKTSSKTKLDGSIVFNLTPSEIFDACGVGFQSGFSQAESRVGEYESLVVWRHDVKNERTGSSCRIAVIEYEKESEDAFDFVTEYIVELEVGDRFVVFLWQSSLSEEDNKENAHQTFIKVCSLIGVKVGYHLVTNPSPY
jgi:hypothetical protein